MRERGERKRERGRGGGETGVRDLKIKEKS